MVPMGVIWHAWCLYFGVLEDPGTILGRSWDIGGHKEGPCEVQAWILSIFWWFWGPILRAFWAFLDQKIDLFISISRLLFLLVFGSKLGCLGLEKHGFGMGGIAKINFCRNWISYDSRVDFSWFWVALGPIFMAFVALETGSKIDEFSWWFWGHPRSWAPSGLRAMAFIFWGQ